MTTDSDKELDSLVPTAVRVMVAATEKHTRVLEEQNSLLKDIANNSGRTAKYVNGRADGTDSLIDDITNIILHQRNGFSSIIDDKLRIFYYKVGAMLIGASISIATTVVWVLGKTP